MTTEIISIIAVCISGITALCSACVPAILNAKTKREELALKREIEEEKLKQEREAQFENFYQAHIKILDDFLECYINWKNRFTEVSKFVLVTYVSKLSLQFRGDVQKALNDFVNKIQNYNTGDNFDEDFKNCLDLILKSYGLSHSEGSGILLSDILRSTLKTKYNKLQNLKIDCFNRLII